MTLLISTLAAVCLVVTEALLQLDIVTNERGTTLGKLASEIEKGTVGIGFYLALFAGIALPISFLVFNKNNGQSTDSKKEIPAKRTLNSILQKDPWIWGAIIIIILLLCSKFLISRRADTALFGIDLVASLIGIVTIVLPSFRMMKVF